MRPLLVAVVLASCAPSQQSLRAPVHADLDRRLGERAQLDADIAPLLAKPLDQAAAVRIALANSARLRASLAQLGVAGGELAAAIGLGPLDVEFTERFGKRNASGRRPYELEITVVQNLVGLITAPRMRASARAELAGARAMATATALRLVARVEIAFQNLLAAQQEVELRRTAFDAADAAAVLRERMHQAGNTPDLALARDRDAREQTRIDLARSEADVEATREELNALLGLSGNQTKWTFAGALPELPAAAPLLDDIEREAVVASLDLAAGDAHVTAAANRSAAERVRMFLPDFGVGASVVEHGSGLEVGPVVRLGIPLFDNRSGQRAAARAELARAEHEQTALAVELRARARGARIRALAAHQQARHIREIVLPLRQQIVDETLLHYNAMNASPFELIVARRELAEAGHQYLDALRRYWNAMSEVTALRRGVQLEGANVDHP